MLQKKARGVIVGKKDACVRTFFCLEWPQDVQDLVCTKDNPDRPITNSDLEMVGLLLCGLVMEEVDPCLHHKHVGLYCDNPAPVSWISRMVAQSSKVAGALLMALSPMA